MVVAAVAATGLDSSSSCSFLLTPAFLTARSARGRAVARKGNRAGAGALIVLSPAAGRMPAPARTGSRGPSPEYVHTVIACACACACPWPKTRHGATDEEAWTMACGPCEPAAEIPPETP
ncbi:hypothetical protein [Streptomyces sp. NPDC054961]